MALEHRGDALELYETIRRFIAWRRRSALTPPASATFNLVYDEADRVHPRGYARWSVRSPNIRVTMVVGSPSCHANRSNSVGSLMKLVDHQADAIAEA
jgi:hypothetical protein